MGNALKAKICDFGSAIVLDLDPDHQLLIAGPGTFVYMPLEAIKDNPKNIEKLDSFSFGVLTIEILTRSVFPESDSQRRQTTSAKSIHDIPSYKLPWTVWKTKILYDRQL